MKFIKLTQQIFDGAGNLKIYTDSTWNNEWVQEVELPPPEPDPAPAPEEEDVPF